MSSLAKWDKKNAPGAWVKKISGRADEMQAERSKKGKGGCEGGTAAAVKFGNRDVRNGKRHEYSSSAILRG